MITQTLTYICDLCGKSEVVTQVVNDVPRDDVILLYDGWASKTNPNGGIIILCPVCKDMPLRWVLKTAYD